MKTEDMKKLAHLAMIELDDNQAAGLRKDLDSMIHFVDHIKHWSEQSAHEADENCFLVPPPFKKNASQEN